MKRSELRGWPRKGSWWSGSRPMRSNAGPRSFWPGPRKRHPPPPP